MGGFMTLGRNNITSSMRRDEPWMTVTFEISGFGAVDIDVPGDTIEEVEQTALEWLASAEWLTVRASLNGAKKRLTFRSAWVAGFTVSGS